MAYDYERVQVKVENGVAVASIDNPPINLMTPALFAELARLAEEIESDAAVRVLVLKSANPDFFIAHFDVEALIAAPTDREPQREEQLNAFHRMCERFRCMPKATIAQIEGRVGGGGSELASSCDMRFGVRGKTIVNQMEVPLGILPGGTGTQRLPRLLGRGRALEVILAGDDLDAETAERWGYLNRTFEADEIAPFVERLARRIASFPAEAVGAAKACVDAADKPLEDGLRDEAYLFQTVLRSPGAQENMRRFLKLGGQTREGELRMGELCAELGRE
ncbi:MAG: enoyl-CoA hydratase/isomerase family protein [Myxococcota bacterium]